MRGLLLLSLGACSFDLTAPTVDLAHVDRFSEEALPPDLDTVDIAQADETVAEQDLAITEDLTQLLPDLAQNTDLVPCGGPSEPCCSGTMCSQSAAQNFGWVGALCVSGTCSACGKPAQPCCQGGVCVDAPQLHAYCYLDPIVGQTCVECSGGVSCQ